MQMDLADMYASFNQRDHQLACAGARRSRTLEGCRRGNGAGPALVAGLMRRLMVIVGQTLRRAAPALLRAAARARAVDPRSVLASAVGAALALSGAAAITGGWIDLSARPYISDGLDAVPARDVAIVPGCRVHGDGRPSAALADRLATARELYLDGRVEKILASGDHRAPEYDETNAMWRWLTERGVPSRDVFLDHAGLRTLDTMERAARVFGVMSAVVCTQEFHLPRAVFLARRAGIDAVGVAADRRIYAKRGRDRLREFFAKSVSFVDSYLLHTEPRHLGQPISIRGDAAATHDRGTGR
jgi:SanA protein